MATTQCFEVQRFSITFSKSFGEIVKAIDAAISHPDVKVFSEECRGGKILCGDRSAGAQRDRLLRFYGVYPFRPWRNLAKGSRGAGAAESTSRVIGNPLIMKQMVEHVPDAGLMRR